MFKLSICLCIILAIWYVRPSWQDGSSVKHPFGNSTCPSILNNLLFTVADAECTFPGQVPGNVFVANRPNTCVCGVRGLNADCDLSGLHVTVEASDGTALTQTFILGGGGLSGWIQINTAPIPIFPDQNYSISAFPAICMLYSNTSLPLFSSLFSMIAPTDCDLVSSLEPIICPCNSSNAFCSESSSCTQCTKNGCNWCEETSTCSDSGRSCSSHITNPQYCPVNRCNPTDCFNCTSNQCFWCLDSQSCVAPEAQCPDRISSPKYCPT